MEDREIFIIDGYNLLQRGFDFLAGEDLQLARQKLEVRLREFRRARGPGTWILLVYDGAGDVPALLSAGGDPEFRTIFSLPPQTADDAILDSCRRLRGEGRLAVVTSDRKDIADRLRRLRIRHFSSEEFADILDETMSRPPKAAHAPSAAGEHPAREKPSPEDVSPAEVDEWMRIFSRPRPPRRDGRKGDPPERRP